MVALVVGTLDDTVLGEFFDALRAEGMTARQRRGLLVIVVVGLEADAALKYRVHYWL